jgi:hypothetical protein
MTRLSPRQTPGQKERPIMRNLIRNMTLSAAALAATLVTAPTVSADQRGGVQRENRERQGRVESPRRDVNRGRDFDRNRDRGFHGNEGFRAHVTPRYFAPRFVSPRYAPFQVFGGIRFYSTCPGPGYVYISDGDYEGWVYPPYLGAVWLPGHYDRFGIWCGGRWR